MPVLATPFYIMPDSPDFSGVEDLDFHHVPVLAQEVCEGLCPESGQIILDGTLGGGGHSRLFLEAGATVIGVDQDFAALQSAAANLAQFGERFRALYGNFRDAANLCADLGITQLDGILLDIGVSSHQLDRPERGFSFQADGPLDMRMDSCGQVTAADLVNNASETELIRIFREFGEEPSARKAAAAIVKIRESTPIVTTLDLASAIEGVLPRRGPKHPATRIFQALRIAVNDELHALSSGLANLMPLLKKDGRFAVITFHSLEDRIVKHFFRTHSQPELDDPTWSAPRPNPNYCCKLITRHPVEASAEELWRNTRSRSARLRIVQKTTSIQH